MSDADGRVIPLTEDDQGEGIKDFFDVDELTNQFKTLSVKMNPQETFEKGKSDSEMLQLVLDKIEDLDRKVDKIFGGYVLIEGRWWKQLM